MLRNSCRKTCARTLQISISYDLKFDNDMLYLTISLNTILRKCEESREVCAQDAHIAFQHLTSKPLSVIFDKWRRQESCHYYRAVARLQMTYKAGGLRT